MEAKRKVDFRILFNMLKSRGPISVIGIVFTLLTFFVFIPLVIILPNTLIEPYQKYNFKELENKGTEKKATITDIKVLTNVSDNGQNPQVITYSYNNNGENKIDKFQTLELEKTTNFNIGSDISIFTYQNQSIIKGIKPYYFPVQIFYLFPVIFGTIGILFLLLSLLPALKVFNLYKTGVIKDAYIISIETNNSVFPTRNIRSSMKVNYYFIDDFKNKIIGESATNDLLFVNGKRPGDSIKIFVSEKDESRSCLVPSLEAMKYNWNI